jgi:hypothetical protein
VAGFFAALGVFALAWLLSIVTLWALLLMLGVQVVLWAFVPQRAFRLAFAITTVVVFVLLAIVLVTFVQAMTEFSS